MPPKPRPESRPYKPESKDLGVLADLFRDARASQQLAHYLTVGRHLIGMKPPPTKRPGHRKVRHYGTDWARKVATGLRAKQKVRASESALFRLVKFAEADVAFQAQCLATPGF